MGANSLTTQTGGTIDETHLDEYLAALVEDFLPRNSSGVVTDQAGDLGSSLLRFMRSYVKTYHLGTVASGLNIKETSGDLIFDIGGSPMLRITPHRKTVTTDGSDPGVGGTSRDNAATQTGTDIRSTSTSFVDLADTTISTQGRPVFVTLHSPNTNDQIDSLPAEESLWGYIQMSDSAAAAETQGEVIIKRDSTVIGRFNLRFDSGGSRQHCVFPGEFNTYDSPAAGTYVYSAQFRVSNQTGVVEIRSYNIEIIAIEVT